MDTYVFCLARILKIATGTWSIFWMFHFVKYTDWSVQLNYNHSVSHHHITCARKSEWFSLVQCFNEGFWCIRTSSFSSFFRMNFIARWILTWSITLVFRFVFWLWIKKVMRSVTFIYSKEEFISARLDLQLKFKYNQCNSAIITSFFKVEKGQGNISQNTGQQRKRIL